MNILQSPTDYAALLISMFGGEDAADAARAEFWVEMKRDNSRFRIMPIDWLQAVDTALCAEVNKLRPYA